MEVENTWMNNLQNILQARVIDWEIFDKHHEAYTEFFQELLLVWGGKTKTWIKPNIKSSKPTFYVVGREQRSMYAVQWIDNLNK